MRNSWLAQSYRMVGVFQAFYRAAMKKSANLLGCALLFLGAIWTFQGIGVVGGSFMTGQSLWVWIGLLTMLAGVALLIWINRRRRPKP